MTFIKIEIGIHEESHKQEKNRKDFRAEKSPEATVEGLTTLRSTVVNKKQLITTHQHSLFFEGLYENYSNISAKKTTHLRDLNYGYLKTNSSLGHPHSQYNSSK